MMSYEKSAEHSQDAALPQVLRDSVAPDTVDGAPAAASVGMGASASFDKMPADLAGLPNDAAEAVRLHHMNPPLGGKAQPEGPKAGSPGAGAPLQKVMPNDEYLRVRRASHKEVEKRRRDAISEGITELASLLPNGEKTNKGSILLNAARYIHDLKLNEERSADRWRYERRVLEQQRNEMQRQVSALQKENERLKREISAWRQTASASPERAGELPSMRGA